MSQLLSWLYKVGTFFHPRLCAVCGAPLTDEEEKVCESCLAQFPYVEDENFFDNSSTHRLITRFPVRKAYSIMHYHHDDESHQLLIGLKYRHRPDLGFWMGRRMACELEPRGFFQDIDCIIAVPLHWHRHLKRGYNQSLELARGISYVTGLPVLRRELVRVRNNKSQTQMSHTERLRNVENLFRVRHSLSGRHVLLVDDVLTTGSTLSACAQAIMKASDNVRISVLTLARS